MARLSSVIKSKLLPAANKAVRETTAGLGGEHLKKGGYFRLFTLPNATAGHMYLEQLYEGWIGGKSNFENFAKYQVLSFEKALRLAQNGKVHSHVSAWQSRSDLDYLFAGAVLLRCDLDPSCQRSFILSFSGLPELGDEAAMLKTATSTWKVRSDPLEIIKFSKNRLAARMLGYSDSFL